MNLRAEQQANGDKAGKVKSCFACNCEHDISVGVFDCKVLWEPSEAQCKH